MNRAFALIAVSVAAALALTACASSASNPAGSAAGPPSATGIAANPAGSPSAVASPLPAGEEGAICADLSATLITDGQPDVQGVQSIYHISEAQVMQAVKDKCPSLSQDMSAS
jgi:hypothetical protein